MRKVVKSVVRMALPKFYYGRVLERMQSGGPDPEMRFLPWLVDPRKTSIDIGAEHGVYTAHLLKHSKKVVAFEPREPAKEFNSLVRALKCDVRWERVALSDREGSAKMRIPAECGGLSTIEPTNNLDYDAGCTTSMLEVPVKRLDDYGLQDVGFVKIDVEGHEAAVLSGGEQTFKRSRPCFFVECEERHSKGAVHKLIRWMRERSYDGFYWMNDSLHDIDTFDIAKHQIPSNLGDWRDGWARRGVYVNNFMFVPTEKSLDFVGDARAA